MLPVVLLLLLLVGNQMPAFAAPAAKNRHDSKNEYCCVQPSFVKYQWKGTRYDDQGSQIKAGTILSGRDYIDDEIKAGTGVKFK